MFAPRFFLELQLDEDHYSHREQSDEERKGLLEILNRQGYVVLPDCIDPELLAPVNARVDELYAEQAKAMPSEPEQPKQNQAFILNLAGCGPQFTSLLTQPNLIGITCSSSQRFAKVSTFRCEQTRVHSAVS